jgi:LPS sulfotransferase NodH
VAEGAPFFVVGSERSGTTMLRLMLNRHSRLCVPPESHFVTRLVDRFGTPPAPATFREALAAEPRFREWQLPLDAVRLPATERPTWAALFDAVFGAYAAAEGKVRWGDKTPVYVTRVETLREIFGPQARFVHIVRDGRDVAASLKGVAWNVRSVAENARTWRHDVETARAFGRRAPEAYHEVVYERLVADPEHELRAVCAHLGEPFEPAMLQFFDDADAAIPAHRRQWHRNATRPVNDSAIGRWREDLTPAEIAQFEWIAGSLLADLGYPASGVSPVRMLPLVVGHAAARFRARLGRSSAPSA